MSLTPRLLRATFARWSAAGATQSVIGARFRVLRSAIGWAYDERIIDTHPIRTMRGPGRLEPRRPLTDDELRAVLATAEANVLTAVANDDGCLRARQVRQYAEQDLLLVRLAADCGARRGELAAFRFDDRDGRVLHISRAVSAGEVGSTKSRQARTLTLGASTARLWEILEADWQARGRHRLGPWVFARDNAHHQRLSASTLDHRFRRLRDHAGVPGASLHRLRHNVATFLEVGGVAAGASFGRSRDRCGRRGLGFRFAA